MFERPDHIESPLYVVTTVFNPVRFRSRWRLYQDFAKHVACAGAILYTVEVAFGERQFAVTEAGNPRHLQLVTNDELWLKENSLNLMIERLPLDWKYVAWIDADVTFVRPDWANETLHQLQHYDVVQMFSDAIDVSPSFETLTRAYSYAWCRQQGLPFAPDGNYYGRKAGDKSIYWHPGYAWACRRQMLEHVGGLVDWAVLGAADRYMADALIGHATTTDDLRSSPSAVRRLELWRDRAEKYVRRNLGLVSGTLCHHWHGHKKQRYYETRGQILKRAGFDPDVDLVRDVQGLWQLNPESIALRDGLRGYFRSRNEDAI